MIDHRLAGALTKIALHKRAASNAVAVSFASPWFTVGASRRDFHFGSFSHVARAIRDVRSSSMNCGGNGHGPERLPQYAVVLGMTMLIVRRVTKPLKAVSSHKWAFRIYFRTFCVRTRTTGPRRWYRRDLTTPRGLERTYPQVKSISRRSQPQCLLCPINDHRQVLARASGICPRVRDRIRARRLS
jgi:hypothetical protein